MSAGSSGVGRDVDASAREAKKPAGGSSGSVDETSAFSSDADVRGTHERSAGFELKGDSSSDAQAPLPERVGRYRVKKMLGRGGMGCVYLAHDEQLDRPVALKVPKLTGDPNSTLQQRFFREARAAAVLNHPNICPIFDIGQQGDIHFIAMGYIDGRPLAAYIESNKRQPCRQSAVVTRKIALALADAHAKGIIHRDLKPANIMIDHRGEPIVMDFGLASRFDDENQTRLTKDGMVVGTLAYMSPEQLDNRATIGPASDVYSLGVVLYELLTGQCAFRGNVGSVVAQILSNEPKPIAEIREDVPPVLADICRRAMAKNPADRFGSMKEFADALAAYLKGATTTAIPATTRVSGPSPDLEAFDLLTAAAASAPAGTGLSDRGLLLPRKRSRMSSGAIFGIAGGAIGVLALIVVAVMATGGGSDPPVKNEPAPAVVEKTTPLAATNEKAEPAVNKPRFETPSAPLESPPASAPAASPVPAGKNDIVVTPPPVESKSPATGDNAPPLELSPAEPPLERRESPPGQQPGGPPHPEPPQIESIDTIKTKFNEMDRNNDGKLDGGELPMHIIMRADTDRDRKASLAEMMQAFQKRGGDLFSPPSDEERRKLPQRQPGGPQGPNDGRKGPRR